MADSSPSNSLGDVYRSVFISQMKSKYDVGAQMDLKAGKAMLREMDYEYDGKARKRVKQYRKDLAEAISRGESAAVLKAYQKKIKRYVDYK